MPAIVLAMLCWTGLSSFSVAGGHNQHRPHDRWRGPHTTWAAILQPRPSTPFLEQLPTAQRIQPTPLLHGIRGQLPFHCSTMYAGSTPHLPTVYMNHPLPCCTASAAFHCPQLLYRICVCHSTMHTLQLWASMCYTATLGKSRKQKLKGNPRDPGHCCCSRSYRGSRGQSGLFAIYLSWCI